jgi:hypothetical protein
MKKQIILYILMVFTVLVNAQTIPKSINKPLDPITKKTARKIVVNEGPLTNPKISNVKKEKPIDDNWKKKYESVSELIDGRYYRIVEKNSRNDKKTFGYADKLGNVIIPLKYDYIGYFKDGLVYFSIDDNNKGFMNSKGEHVFTFQSDSDSWNQENFFDGLIVVKLNNKYGFLNRKGEVAIPFKYEKARWFQEGVAFVYNGDKWGAINPQGKEVLPFKYNDVKYGFDRGKASVIENGKSIFIDKKGNYIGKSPF